MVHLMNGPNSGFFIYIILEGEFMIEILVDQGPEGEIGFIDGRNITFERDMVSNTISTFIAVGIFIYWIIFTRKEVGATT